MNATSIPYSIRSSPRSSLMRFLAKLRLYDTLSLMDRLSLVQCIHRALIRILNRGAEAERIGDDDSHCDRGHERHKQPVLHQVLTAFVSDESLYELEHRSQPPLDLVDCLFSHPRSGVSAAP